MTSDTSDIPGPIPLTRARLGETSSVLAVCFLLLGACQCLAHAVLQVEVVLCSELEDATGHETHRAREER